MKQKLTKVKSKLEDHIMFFFPDDNPDLNMQGCLNKNTLARLNISHYVTLSIKKEKKGYRYSIYDMKGKEIYFEHSKRNLEERLKKLPVKEYLTKIIQGTI